MSWRGSFSTDIIEDEKDFKLLKEMLINDSKFLCTQVCKNNIPIISGKIASYGFHCEKESIEMFTDAAREQGLKLNNDIKITIIPDDDTDSYFIGKIAKDFELELSLIELSDSEIKIVSNGGFTETFKRNMED